ncbi:MAG: hypothetical protein RL095_3975 [Verrucomicrobiota bacterium]|jgi:cysteamine dioxygenase
MPISDRRQFITLSAKAFLAAQALLPLLAGCSAAPAAPAASPPPLLTWEQLLARLRQISEVQFTPGWDQESQVRDVEAALRIADLDCRQVRDFCASYKNSRKDFPEIRVMHEERSFQISMLEFEPGEFIPLHDHPGMTGVAFCTEGEVEVKAYDPQGEISNQRLWLKPRPTVIASPGLACTLTATRGNIHSLKATRFTRMIDIFAPPYSREIISRCRFYAPLGELNPEGLLETEVRLSPPSN